jgi:chromatin structure-remodeling complex subunit RSC3/30
LKFEDVKSWQSLFPADNLIFRSHSLEASNPGASSPIDDDPIPPSRLISNAEPGFLGSTAYNAVLEESEENALVADHTISSPLPTPFVSQRLREAFSVLAMLNDFPNLERLIHRWVTDAQMMSILGPFATSFGVSIRETLFRPAVHQKTDKQKVEVVQSLFQNTARKLAVGRSTRFHDYTQMFIGSSMRWECLGLFFTACGLCCNHLTVDAREYEFVGHREEDKQGLMSRLLDASNTCLTFCEDSGPLSDMAIWLALENCIYASQVLGDAHYIVWRKLGDLSTAIYASGIHQHGRGTSDIPFWLTEMRTRALGTSYSIDKLLCTFVGRPPRISKRYCHISPPLDLEFTELALEGADLEQALANIGEDGWNRNPAGTKAVRGRKSVYQRCFVLNALLREEVLELSLGPDSDDILQRSE